jgi:hypothetical protein
MEAEMVALAIGVGVGTTFIAYLIWIWLVLQQIGVDGLKAAVEAVRAFPFLAALGLLAQVARRHVR